MLAAMEATGAAAAVEACSPQSVSASELAALLERGEELMVCDVRSSRLFVGGHIRHAFSLAASSLQARRIARGKGRVRDIVPSDRKSSFTAMLHRRVTVVIYDERSSTVAAHGTNPLHLFCTVLAREAGGPIVVLRGGYASFVERAPHLCERPQSWPTGSLSIQVSMRVCVYEDLL